LSLGSIITLVMLTFATFCGLGTAACREVMLDEVRRKLPEGQTIPHSRSSFKVFEIIRLHEQYYPESRVRAVNRFLMFATILTIASMALIGIFFSAFKTPIHR
jgi:hypothetical protein